MTAKDRYRSEAMEAIYESALAMHQVGAISQAELSEYERECLKPSQISKDPIMDVSPSVPIGRDGVTGEIMRSRTVALRASRRKSIG